MNFKLKIARDIKDAMKQKEELSLLILRMLSSAIHSRELEKRARSGKAEELNEEEVIAVIRSEAKKCRDAIIEFEKGGRKDLAEKESAELKILEAYLPPQMSDEEVEKNVREVVAQLGAVGEKDFGRVMGETMKRIKGRVSGERVSGLVKRNL